MSNIGKFIDRSPILCSAGIKCEATENVSELLKYYPVIDQFNAIKTEHNITGIPKIKYVPKNKSIEDKYKGYATQVREILVPEAISKFDQFKVDLHEAIYNSSKTKPLGKQGLALTTPLGLTVDSRTFGNLSNKSDPLYEIILPTNSNDIIDHNIAKQFRRYPELNINLTFGKQSGMDVRGFKTKACVNDTYNPSCMSNSYNINTTLDEYREKNVAPLGKTFTHSKEIAILKDNVTFGKACLNKFADKVEDLIQYDKTNLEQKELYKCLAYLNKIRQLYKHRNFNFKEIIKYLKSADLDQSNLLSWDTLNKLLSSINIFININQLKYCLKYYKILDEQMNMKYVEFIKLLNYLDPIPKFENLNMQNDIVLETAYYDHFIKDIEKKFSENKNNKIPETMPKKYFNNTERLNLSNETTVETLISPSIFTLYGLSHRDFFKLRNKKEIFEIFRKIGHEVDANREIWDAIWNNCIQIDEHPGDLVCIDTFKTQLEKYYQT